MSTNELFPSKDEVSDWEDFDYWIVERATQFSVVLFKGCGTKDRREFLSLADSIEWASDNPRKMVYASMESGRSVMLGRKQWPRALEIVGRKA